MEANSGSSTKPNFPHEKLVRDAGSTSIASGPRAGPSPGSDPGGKGKTAAASSASRGGKGTGKAKGKAPAKITSPPPVIARKFTKSAATSEVSDLLIKKPSIMNDSEIIAKDSRAVQDCIRADPISKKDSQACIRAEPPQTTTSKSGPSTSVGGSNFEHRLNKLEEMLGKLVDHLPLSHPQTRSSHDTRSLGDEDDNLLLSDYEYDCDQDDGPFGCKLTPASDSQTSDFSAETSTEDSNATPASGKNVAIPAIAAKFAVPLSVGKPLDEDIAGSVSYLVSHTLEQAALEETGKKYTSPENCPLLDVPKVNLTIWENLNPTTRARDLKLQRIQSALVKGITAFAQTLSASELSEKQQDALGLLCSSNFELNALRKDLIKPGLNAKFAHLCKPQNPVTKQLFGDDLGKKVKDIQEEQRAAAGVVKGSKPFSTGNSRQRPYSQSQSHYHPYRRQTEANYRRMRSAGWTTPTVQAGSVQRPFLGQRSWKPHTATPMTRPNKGSGRQSPQYRGFAGARK